MIATERCQAMLPCILLGPLPGLMELSVCNSSWQGQLNSAMLCTHSGNRQWCGFCFYDGLLCEGTEATRGVRMDKATSED